MRNSFIFYGSWWEAIENLPRDIQGDVLTSIIEYGLYGETTDNLKPITKAMLAIVKPQIDANRKRFENGKKGGRPKTETKPNNNQEETKGKPNNNQTITKAEPNNDNVNDIYKETTTDVVVKKKAIRNNSPDLSFVDEDFKDLFMEWLEYKRDRKENYKSEKSLKMCYNRLLKLSGNDCNQARLVVEQSIASNYAGLFELKNYGAKTTYSNIHEQNRKGSEQRKLNSVLAVATTVREAAAKKRAELEAEGIIDKIP